MPGLFTSRRLLGQVDLYGVTEISNWLIRPCAPVTAQQMHSPHKKNSGKHSGIPENMPKNSEIPEFQYWFGIAITSVHVMLYTSYMLLDVCNAVYNEA